MSIQAVTGTSGFFDLAQIKGRSTRAQSSPPAGDDSSRNSGDVVDISPISANQLTALGGFSAQNTLSVSEKQVVQKATGWDIDADPMGKTASQAALQFAGRLTLDQHSLDTSGTSPDGFTGQVTRAFIEGLIQEQSGSPGTIPLSTLYQALDYVDNGGSTDAGNAGTGT